jgi:hypothetical protein
MKKFLLKTLLYLSLIFSLFAIIVFITNSGLRKSDFGNLKEWREVLAGEVNADVLINGSSRAWVQYNPMIIDSLLLTNSYNLFGKQQSSKIYYSKRRSGFIGHGSRLFSKISISTVSQ